MIKNSMEQGRWMCQFVPAMVLIHAIVVNL